MSEMVIERLGHLGEGVAPGPVFVPLTLPGERVEGTVDEGRMLAPRILQPSSDRVRPPCRHFKSCGGCSLQHASDDFVARWKQQVVEQALAAQSIAAPVRALHVSPPGTRRRAQLGGRRLKSGALVGFHRRRSNDLVAIEDCKLLHPGLMAALPALADITTLGATRKGALRLTVTHSPAGVDLAVEGGKPVDRGLFADLAQVAQAHGLARLSWDGAPIVTLFPPYQRMGRARVVPPPGAFLQATDAGQAALVAAVRDALGPARRIADIFAGCGTFTLPLAAYGEVHAVEFGADMLAALEKGWREASGLHRVSTEPRDLFRRPLLVQELERFDGVVIDPPRAGAEAQMEQIASSRLSRVAAVSCNPVSFARDARILIRGGFRLNWLEIVDQFRWSPHVELVASFTR